MDSTGVPSRARLVRDAELLVRHLRAVLPQRVNDLPEELPPGARSAAVLAPVYAISGEPWVVFTRRTETLRSHSGQISFPGGRKDPGDTSLWMTAVREAHEEVALPTGRAELVGALPAIHAVVSDNFVQPYVGWLGEGEPPLAANPSEVAEILHIPLAVLADPAVFHEEIWSRNGESHAVTFYDVGPNRIWGLTGSIVRSLLALLPPA